MKKELHSSVKLDNLLYQYKAPTKDKYFSTYNDAKSLFNMIKDQEPVQKKVKQT